MNNLQFNRSTAMGAALLLGLVLPGLLVLALAGSTRPAAASHPVCNVPSEVTTIQAAINDGGCATINVASGTYTENLNIARSLTLQGAGMLSTTIDGSVGTRVITVTGLSTVVTINDLRITGGDATSAPTIRNGGGIFVTGGATLHGEELQIDNNRASSAVSGFGGGLAVFTGTAYLTDSVIYSNTANYRGASLTGSGRGGGLYVNSTSFLSLVSSQVLSNVASTRAGSGSAEVAAGGGLFVGEGAQASLRGNTWQGNVARGVGSDACSTCILTDISGDGGAIAVFVTTNTSLLTVTNDSFIGNIANASITGSGTDEAARGGAISLLASQTSGQITATLIGVTMVGNTAKNSFGADEGRGGAVHARHATLVVGYATITDNYAARTGDGSGGGIYIREPEQGDSLEVVNSVLADNVAFIPSGSGDGAQVFINYTNLAADNIASFVHTTIADADLNPKQGIYYFSSDASDRLYITNTMITSHAIGLQNVNATGRGTARYTLFHGNTVTQTGTALPDTTGNLAGQPDPLFIDPAARDYHIRSGSPAVDAATDAGVTDDIDGDDRTLFGGFDIGADEVGARIYIPVVLKNY